MEYKTHLQSEKIKDKYDKPDLLKEKYLFDAEENIQIFYAPFEYVNTNANIIIVGITPGWSQMERSYRSAINSFNKDNNWIEAIKDVKKQASFAGSMRNNLVAMLDELELNKKLNIDTTLQFFDEHNSIVHTTSIIKYPTFYKGKNYTGKQPSPILTNILMEFIKTHFVPEINNFENKLIIPLGNCVSNVLIKLNEEKLIKKNIILDHFPHPSGANGHRKKQFIQHKAQMFDQINNWNPNL